MMQSQSSWHQALHFLIISGAICGFPGSALAQLLPIADDTLGNERSIVSPDQVINTLPSNRIDGGARRGANLFHSFREFNVDNGRGVYFTNPADVTNILTRVTGGNRSEILGTLGVLGNANLFLLNPNGILFGPNAQLDIRGSFVASTANGFKFSDGREFSATDPQAPPLLSINVPLGLQYGSSQPGTTIANRGNLSVGQDLQFIADRLDLQGQLIAGRDLVLQAQDTVKVRDTVVNPFVARSGGQLTIQGNQGIDILALSHPQQTAFVSNGNLSLLSDGAISGDAHFRSGGEFRIQSLSGQLVNFTSLYDPIISSTGNVDVAANYSGASLLIESQGNVRVQGTVTIDAPDTVSTFVGEDVALRTQPGLIIRSGQTGLVYGGTSQNTPPGFTSGTVPSGITLANAVRVQPNAQGGVVRLTAAEGGISFSSINASSTTGGNGGTIALSATGDITNTGSFFDPFGLAAALGSFSYTTTGDSRSGGNISVISTSGSITLNNAHSPSYSYSAIGNSGSGGNISFAADAGNITLNTSVLNANAQSVTGNAGSGGNITLSTGSGDITLNDSNLRSDSQSNSGNAGSGGNILLSTGAGNITLNNSNSQSNSFSFSGTARQGGAIAVVTNLGNILLTNTDLSSDSISRSGIAGNGGAISLAAHVGDITLTNTDLFSDSRSISGRAGNGGAISYATNVGDITLTNSVSDSYSRSGGAAGNGGIISFATNIGNITLDNSRSDAISGSFLGSAGNGGAISYATNVGDITLTNSSLALSYSYSDSFPSGNGGTISFATNSGNITLTDSVADSDSKSYRPAGNGGAISFRATNLGNITLTNSIADSYSASDSGPAGNGGAISLTTNSGNLALINSIANSYSVSRLGVAGNGGAISLTTNSGNLALRSVDPAKQGTLNSYSGSESGAAGNGGAIQLSARRGAIAGTDAILNSFAVSQTETSGNGGIVILEARSGISGLTIKTVASSDSSGDVQINGFGNLLIDSTNILTAQQITQQLKVEVCLIPPCSSPTNPPLTVDINLVLPSGKGQAGNVRIDSIGDLTFRNSLIQSDTRSGNPAGNTTITSSGSVTFNNSQIISNTSSAGTAGNISIQGNQDITVTDGSQLSAQASSTGNAGSISLDTPILTVAGNAQVIAKTTGNGRGGSITIDAPIAVNLQRVQDVSPILSVETSGAGKAGSITINTPSLTLSEQARITATATATATSPQGGGSITLNASNLDLAGIVGVFAETQGQAPAGTLRLNPYSNQPDLDITLTPNSQISASTSGSGTGGDLIVTAPQFITITGPGRFAVETSSTGNAGNMNFTTQQLTLQDGVEISASTSSTGKAGNIGINAETFTLNGGARVSTDTSSGGAAGNITVQVNDRLILTGQGTGLFASTAPGSTGTGGNIAIDPRLVQIEDGATIAVDSRGRGTGGNISLRADRLILNQQGSITAETASAQGGNISLDVRDLLLMRRNSLISATAGTAQAGGDGGNISFNGNFIVAVPNENSDISANAFTGRGGSIEINAQSLFGIQFRPQLTPLSDITASSEFGVAGVVAINTPDLDPSRGLLQLPVDLTDASRLIVQTCPTGNTIAKQPNEFIITGRGGLPPTPREAVNRDAIQVDLVTADGEASASVSQTAPDQNPLSSDAPIVEAQGWQVAADGAVYLVAVAPANSIKRGRDRFVHCR
jgi:filamentous hemagglutinin family protein